MILVVLFADDWYSDIEFGRLVLLCTLVLFAQTLLRDFWLLYRARRNRSLQVAERRATCFCLESSVAFLLLIVGLGLFLTNTGGTWQMTSFRWSVVIGMTLLCGFAMRDFVIQWRPWSVYRDPDHGNIIPVNRLS
ncbi:MAG: hypothetical protein AAF402_12415 [Pseudomonadota bacterium]